MPAHGKVGLGTTFSFNGSLVSDLTKIGGVEISVDTIDITTLDSLMKEFAAGIPDGGSVEIEGNLYPGDTTGQVALKNAVGGALANCIITLPAAFAASWAFTGLVTSFKTGEVTSDGVVSFTASIKVSGLPVLAIASSVGLTTPFFSISNAAVINPAPSGSIYDYVATVLTGVTSVTVTPTATAGVITVNGNVTNTGVASAAIQLGGAGSITDINIVVTEENKMPKTYKIKLSRP